MAFFHYGRLLIAFRSPFRVVLHEKKYEQRFNVFFIVRRCDTLEKTAIQVKILKLFLFIFQSTYRQDSAVLVSSKGNTTTTPKIVPAAATNNNNNGNSNNSNDAKKTAGTVESQMTRSEKEERGKAFRQVVVAFIANIATINTGLIFGFSAVAIPQLEAEDSYIKVDKYQASWVGE